MPKVFLTKQSPSNHSASRSHTHMEGCRFHSCNIWAYTDPYFADRWRPHWYWYIYLYRVYFEYVSNLESIQYGRDNYNDIWLFYWQGVPNWHPLKGNRVNCKGNWDIWNVLRLGTTFYKYVGLTMKPLCPIWYLPRTWRSSWVIKAFMRWLRFPQNGSVNFNLIVTEL